jgi:hypothetical protein
MADSTRHEYKLQIAVTDRSKYCPYRLAYRTELQLHVSQSLSFSASQSRRNRRNVPSSMTKADATNQQLAGSGISLGLGMPVGRIASADVPPSTTVGAPVSCGR